MKSLHSLGQVFLRNKEYIGKILASMDIKDKEVLEIGPGDGCISVLISQKVKYLWCVELDKRFYTFLSKKFEKIDNVKIINSDILKFDLSKLNDFPRIIKLTSSALNPPSSMMTKSSSILFVFLILSFFAGNLRSLPETKVAYRDEYSRANNISFTHNSLLASYLPNFRPNILNSICGRARFIFLNSPSRPP